MYCMYVVSVGNLFGLPRATHEQSESPRAPFSRLLRYGVVQCITTAYAKAPGDRVSLCTVLRARKSQKRHPGGSGFFDNFYFKNEGELSGHLANVAALRKGPHVLALFSYAILSASLSI